MLYEVITHNGIGGAYFMKVDLIDRFTVHPGLGLGNPPEDTQAGFLDFFGQGTGLNDVSNFGKIAMKAMRVCIGSSHGVMVMGPLMRMRLPMIMSEAMIMMVVMGMLLRVETDINTRTVDAVAVTPGNLQCKLIVNAEFGQLAAQILRFNTKINQGGQVHSYNFV